MSRYHYLLLSFSPPLPPNSELKIRQTIHESLIQSFGVTLGSIYVDILSLKEGGSEAVVRVDAADVKAIMASLTVHSLNIRVVKETAFLPSLLSTRVQF
ncbi:hypothetical protein L218DRAFT_960677 [Marasmius fiardii PR-910]|nr:hypothetical protein L218DRAFT_960677 [Marasmius fiardii PR-910]